jgi:signal transduction histidine kinase
VNLVRRTVEDFRQEPVASGYDIAFHANGSAIVEADANALSIAVRNLLDNAVKYSPKSNPRRPTNRCCG